MQKTRKNSGEVQEKEEKEEIDSDQELQQKIQQQQKKEETRKKKKEEKQLMKIARGKNASLNIAGIEEDTELFSLNRHKKQFKQAAGFVDIEEDQMEEPEDKRNRVMKQANQ